MRITKNKLPEAEKCIGYKVINNDGDTGRIINYIPGTFFANNNSRVAIKFDIGGYVNDYDKYHVTKGKFKHPLRRKYFKLLGGRYNQMISRCYNPNSSEYERYGAKGVYVCDEWKNSVTQYYYDVINKERFDEELVRKNLLQLDKDYSGENYYSNETTIWVTPAENSRKQRPRRVPYNSKSGVKGVNYESSRNRWRVRFKVNGKFVDLGRFNNLEDAKKVKKQWEVRNLKNNIKEGESKCS